MKDLLYPFNGDYAESCLKEAGILIDTLDSLKEWGTSEKVEDVLNERIETLIGLVMEEIDSLYTYWGDNVWTEKDADYEGYIDSLIVVGLESGEEKIFSLSNTPNWIWEYIDIPFLEWAGQLIPELDYAVENHCFWFRV